jgi:hypothetical protein
MRFGLEGTSPSSVAFLLTILTIVIINSLYLKIVAIEQIFQLLILLSSQNLLKLVHSFLELVISVSHYNNMERLIVLEDVFVRLICPPTSYCYLAT